MQLNGKVAVITGASGGIGEAIARNLAESGVRLVLNARDETKLGALAKSLPAVELVPGDLGSDETLPDRLLRAALDRFGQADILVNNAGMMHVGAIDSVDLSRVRAMLRLNVEALVMATYCFLRHFKPQGSGFVVNITSIAGLKTVATHAAYNASKTAVEALTDSLRMELAGTGVGVAALAPGTVATNLYTGWEQSSRDFVFSGGALAPEDIARCVRFILEQPPHVLIARMLAVPAAQPV